MVVHGVELGSVKLTYPAPPAEVTRRDWPPNRDGLTLGGATVTFTGGFRVTVAEADLVGSATLVAFTVTVC